MLPQAVSTPAPSDAPPIHQPQATVKEPVVEAESASVTNPPAPPASQEGVIPVTQLASDFVSAPDRVRSLRGKTVRVSGVIGEIDAYQDGWNSKLPQPELRLESGLPELAVDMRLEHMIKCEFSQPDKFKGLKVGQTVVLSGKLRTVSSILGRDSFILTDCVIEATQPFSIASAPEFPFKDAHDIWRQSSSKYQELEEELDGIGITVRSQGGKSLEYDVEVSNSASAEDVLKAVSRLNEVPLVGGVTLRGVDDDVASSLQELRYVERLTLYDAELTSIGLSALLKLPGLHSLSVGNPKTLQAADFQSLENVPSLRAFDYWGPPYDSTFAGSGDEFFQQLKHTPELRKLSVSSINVSDEGLSSLASLPNLYCLSLPRNGFSGSGLSHLANPMRLLYLTLSGNDLNDSVSEPLSRCRNLVKLTLSNCQVTSAISKSLAELKELRNLDLSNTQVDNAIAEGLTNLKQLENLNLSSTLIDDEFELPIQNMPQLRELILANTEIGGNFCERLGTSTSLQNLNLISASVSDDDIKRLVSRHQTFPLLSIELENTPISEAALLDLIKIPTLERISVPKEMEISKETRDLINNRVPEVRLGIY